MDLIYYVLLQMVINECDRDMLFVDKQETKQNKIEWKKKDFHVASEIYMQELSVAVHAAAENRWK